MSQAPSTLLRTTRFYTNRIIFITVSLGSVLSFLALLFAFFSLSATSAEARSVQSSCVTATWAVNDEAELNEAIGCYNSTVSGTYATAFQIELLQDITLTADSMTITNSDSLELAILGSGFTLDGANSYRPISIESGDITIQGITITNGYHENFGGGVYIEYVDPPFVCGGEFSEECVLIYDDAPTLLITDSLILSNTALVGGGVFNRSASVTIENSEIRDNQATGSDSILYVSGGGGVFNYNSSGFRLSNSLLSGNSAVYNGGGLQDYVSYSATIEGTTFDGNRSDAQGGGMYTYYSKDLLFTSNVVSGNVSVANADNGGGLYIRSSESATISDNQFVGNEAYRGGGTYFYGGGDTEVRGNQFERNTSSSVGGGIYILSSTGMTFTGNLVFG